ncbi:MAG: tetratricopeptide repeat protein, partial [Candidatus Heimdallarchaeaceae archaeon]
MRSDEFDLPNEFSLYEKFIQEDFINFYPVFSKYTDLEYSFFQSIVYASDDLANSLQISEESRINYTLIALTGYFLLSQYKKVLTFPIPVENLEVLFFRFKSAKYLGEKSVVSTLLANIISLMVELKKQSPKLHKDFSIIMSIEIASMNSDVSSIQRYSMEFKSMLLNTILIKDYPLLTLQVVSDLAYREFRTGDEAYSGWLEIYKELAEALNMETKRLDCYTMLGGLYRFKGYLEEASEYYSKAVVMAENIGNKEFIASLIANMADLEHTRGNLEKALFLCKEALKDPEISKSKPSIYITLSEVLIKQEQYEEAISTLDIALPITGHKSPIINLLYGFALTKIPGK